MAIRPGISFSASSISRRPKAASDFIGTLSAVSLCRSVRVVATYDVCDLEFGSWRSVHICGISVGIGLEAEMLEKYIREPAIGILMEECAY